MGKGEPTGRQELADDMTGSCCADRKGSDGLKACLSSLPTRLHRQTSMVIAV